MYAWSPSPVLALEHSLCASAQPVDSSPRKLSVILAASKVAGVSLVICSPGISATS